MVNGSGAKFLRHEIFVALILALYFIGKAFWVYVPKTWKCQNIFSNWVTWSKRLFRLFKIVFRI